MSADRDSDRAAWDRFYQEARFVMVWPSECVVRFVRRHRARHGPGRSALDLGCGNGRHLKLLASEGFESFGCDASRAAVEAARGWLAREGLPGQLAVLDGPGLPYADARFDAALSYGVLDSMLPETAAELVAELRRCLRPGAEFFATLRASADRDFMRVGKEVARNTVRVEEEVEQGTFQHFFDFDEVLDLFRGYEIRSVEREDRIDWLHSGRKYSRWEVLALVR